MIILNGVLRKVESNPYEINGKSGVSQQALVEDTGATLKKLMKVVKLPSDYIVPEKIGDNISWFIDVRDFKDKGVSFHFLSVVKPTK
jgi:hypothetical protein